jgi:phage terminase small subunit
MAVRANELFKDERVITRLAELQEIKAELARREFEVDARYVLNRLVEIDRMDVLDILNDDGSVRPIPDWPKVWRQFISQFDVEELFAGVGSDKLTVGLLKKIKWTDKVKNLALLGKHVDVNAFRDTLAHVGKDGESLQTIVVLPGKDEDPS